MTFSFSTRGERDTIFTMLTVPTSLFSQPPAELLAQSRVSTHWPNKRAAHPVDHNWTGHAQVQISTRLAQSQISTNCFFSKITKIPSPSLTSFTPQSHFLSVVFIMTFVIVTSSTREHELHSIVLSLTKPNDKILPTKNDNIKKSFHNYITSMAICY